jgi:hypothetical protein
VLTLGLSLRGSGAWGGVVNIPDVTWIQNLRLGLLSSWQDRIGIVDPFETYNATYNTDTKVLTIFTNWGENQTATAGTGFPPFVTADMFMDIGCDGNNVNWDAAVRLFGPNKGTVYLNPAITYTKDIPNNVFIGGKWTTNVLSAGPPSFDVPVIGSSATTDTANVVWTALGGLPDWSVAISLGDIDALGDQCFQFLWGTATCGNDVITPIPPSVLLLGSGLVGIWAWRRRRRQ